MTTATRRPSAPTPPATKDQRDYAATIRRLIADPRIWELYETPYQDALVLLKYLRPDAVQCAIRAHDTLTRGVRRVLQDLGFVDTWVPGILLALLDFLTAHGFTYDAGQWTATARTA